MEICPFLSSKNHCIECFKECPIHECKDRYGNCPFKTLEMFKSEIENNYDRVNPDFKGFDFLKEYYYQVNESYF
ncbi:hypothetical protein [Clostridium cochlearium]|uniref:Uncharacterized protein n=1 Tax=Clostridium cochlearium TaxID=1494 RepID=A0A239ZNH5_CLOCO|nr:hypothetical protein [Clostridium cochlearium]MBV1820416.1 hypothetical protein [Bacteroidales bacterium MSK.15.36]NSJ91394.1 hypothetical protein [Coprococcus sp. MSK.21.13]MBE6064097.1 hypothetical protein [Clostridium cochlearium]MBU5269293.1 hypothetical protein [Clostridium cochlearium]MCG4572144.1 hypothetical protein [Clostridium cochlearium]